MKSAAGTYNRRFPKGFGALNKHGQRPEPVSFDVIFFLPSPKMVPRGPNGNDASPCVLTLRLHARPALFPTVFFLSAVTKHGSGFLRREEVGRWVRRCPDVDFPVSVGGRCRLPGCSSRSSSGRGSVRTGGEKLMDPIWLPWGESERRQGGGSLRLSWEREGQGILHWGEGREQPPV